MYESLNTECGESRCYESLDAEYGESSTLTSSGPFSVDSIRKGFIRKVYGILTLQLTFTMGVMGIFFIESVNHYTLGNSWIFWVAFFVYFGLLIALPCCGVLRRKSPYNTIFFAIFTAVQGVLLGAATSTYSANEVFLSVGICALIVLGLIIFTLQTKVEFTMMNGLLFILVSSLCLFGLFWAIFNSQIGMVAYAWLGAVMFSFYIVCDTQLMMGGKHNYSLNPEEYVFATLNLYLDTINLLLMILCLIGRAK